MRVYLSQHNIWSSHLHLSCEGCWRWKAEILRPSTACHRLGTQTCHTCEYWGYGHGHTYSVVRVGIPPGSAFGSPAVRLCSVHAIQCTAEADEVDHARAEHRSAATVRRRHPVHLLHGALSRSARSLQIFTTRTAMSVGLPCRWWAAQESILSAATAHGHLSGADIVLDVTRHEDAVPFLRQRWDGQLHGPDRPAQPPIPADLAVRAVVHENCQLQGLILHTMQRQDLI